MFIGQNYVTSSQRYVGQTIILPACYTPKIMIIMLNSSIFTAPGDYTPEKSAAALLDNAPKYTFGMRTQIYKPNDTPGKL